MYDTTYAAYQNKTMKLANSKQIECWKKCGEQKILLTSWVTDLKGGSSHEASRANEPFFHNGCYGTNKVIKFSKKKQVN